MTSATTGRRRVGWLSAAGGRHSGILIALSYGQTAVAKTLSPSLARAAHAADRSAATEPDPRTGWKPEA